MSAAPKAQRMAVPSRASKRSVARAPGNMLGNLISTLWWAWGVAVRGRESCATTLLRSTSSRACSAHAPVPNPRPSAHPPIRPHTANSQTWQGGPVAGQTSRSRQAHTHTPDASQQKAGVEGFGEGHLPPRTCIIARISAALCGAGLHSPPIPPLPLVALPCCVSMAATETLATAPRRGGGAVKPDLSNSEPEVCG